MRPWLENRINSGEIAGLEWIDKTQLIFKVPWKHVGNREWKEDDSQIFKVTFFFDHEGKIHAHVLSVIPSTQ